jgi:predicted anti-sigma-YlaC factor YlaD
VLGLALGALGALAAVAGARGVLRGAREVAGPTPVLAVVDSEYRFYAAWYLLTGVTLLQAASKPQAARGQVRLVGVGLWTAASGRILSWQQTGRPSTGQLLLLGVELTLPTLLLPWQARVARSARGEVRPAAGARRT